MAKNTSSSAFRKIDVDQYNEDNFKDDEQENQHLSGIDEKEINTLLTQNKNIEALKICLKNAPLLSKNQQLKDQALQLTLRVMISIKPSQMDSIVEELDIDSLDVLMKYVYKGFEFPSDGSSGHLLQWHEKVFAKSGVGSIVRVLTDTSARA
jgi:actin related protein 2/3 complex, subunit 5